MDSTAPILSIAQIVPCTEAEGPGKRFALWFQGCPLRCPGCCNPEFLPFQGGEAWPLDRVVAAFTTAQTEHQIEGITLLGGEPFAHAAAAAALALAVRQLGGSVMVFTGYTLDTLRSSDDIHTKTLLQQIDILVDGPYLRDRPDTERRWIGSTNQGIHFLTARYRANDPCWQQQNTLEIRLTDGVLTVNGFPAPAAKAFWQGKWQRS